MLLCLSGVALAAPQGPVVGRVAVAVGKVTGTDQDGDTFEVKRGGELYAGYTLETGSPAFVKFEMNDGTSITQLEMLPNNR